MLVDDALDAVLNADTSDESEDDNEPEITEDGQGELGYGYEE